MAGRLTVVAAAGVPLFAPLRQAVVKLAFEFLVPTPARSARLRWAEVDRDATAWTRGSVLVSR